MTIRYERVPVATCDFCGAEDTGANGNTKSEWAELCEGNGWTFTPGGMSACPNCPDAERDLIPEGVSVKS